MARLEIFKTGRHTALGGQVLEFSEADLRATVDAYDPDKHEAPLVVGHPGLDAPAYGWVKGLAFADGVMIAEPGQVDPAFAEMVNAGRFKKISGSFYLPDAPNNPAPGVYYLRHVGFLGAQPPAVKGLKNASFAASEQGVVEFGDWADRVEAGLFRKLREWMIGKFGLADADQALPGWEVDAVQEEDAQNDEATAAMPAYAEGTQHTQEDGMETPEQLAAKEAALREKEAAFAEREAKLQQQERAALHREHLDFAEGLIKEGRLLPAHREQAVAMLDCAATLEGGQVVEFGEGKTLAMGEALKSFLAAQPKIVEFGEIAKPEAGTAGQVAFAAAPGYTVDAAALELHARAVAYQSQHPGTEYMAAVRAVQ
ncbi:MAG: hypothetical protein FWD79_05665 [Desulfobulbus sp.]|nr:hypothetical protein [Desulfobulbus sp.]